MDYIFGKKSVPVREAVFDGCFEQPIDLDFTLPDYCPSIEKILKCRVSPKIHSKSLSGDRLTIEGAVTVCVLYIDEEKRTLRSCEHTLPYSGSISVKSDCSDAVIRAYAKPEYINCRAISSRRLDIHGAFSLCARIDAICSREAALDCQSEDLELKKSSVPISRLCSLAQQQFSVADELEPTNGSPAIRSILKSDVKVKPIDCKIAGDKAMARGELIARVLYIADNEAADTAVMEFTLPVTEVIDSPGIESDSRLEWRLELLSSDIRLREDGSGEGGGFISIDCRLCAYVAAYSDEDFEYVSDAYSTLYDLDCEYSNLRATRLCDSTRESFITKSGTDAETNGISRVIDVWGEQCSSEPGFDNGSPIVRGRINACILALDNDSLPFYIERSVDYLCPVKLNIDSPDKSLIEASAEVESISYRLNGGSGIDLRCEIAVSATAYESYSVRALSAAHADEEHKRIKDPDVALTLYFAQRGESLWDIARRYSTKTEAIKRENDVADDELDGEVMLLIPSI